MNKRVIAVVFIVFLAGISVPAGFYYSIQQRFPDMGMIPVVENFIPWIFNLLLWMFAFFVWVGLGLLVVMYYSSSNDDDVHLSAREKEAFRLFLDNAKGMENKAGRSSRKKASRKNHVHPKKPRKPVEKKAPAAQPEKAEKKVPEHPSEWDEGEFD